MYSGMSLRYFGGTALKSATVKEELVAELGETCCSR